MGLSGSAFLKSAPATPQTSPFDRYKLNSRWIIGPMFTFSDLAYGEESDRDTVRDAAPFDGRFLHHLHFWWLEGRPACITSQPYDFERWVGRMPQIEQWARAHWLHACRPGVLRSWWFPGETNLLEFTRGRR